MLGSVKDFMICMFVSASGKQPPQKQRLQPPSININNFKAWPFGDKNAPAFDEETYELAKSAVLLVSHD